MGEIIRSRRSAPGPKERAVSYAVLAILALAVIGIWLKQARFEPDSWRPVPDAADVNRKQETVGDNALAVRLQPFHTERVIAAGTPESFDARTLSDKIDGKADLYLKAGFKVLVTERLRLRSDSALWYEVFLYDMGAGDHAFAVYSQQKRADGVPLNRIRHGYRAENAVFFVHGSDYVEMIGAEASQPLLQAMLESAERFYQAGGNDLTEVSEPERLFPASGLLTGSVALLAADVFGFDGLSRVYVARYRIGTDELTGFLKDCASPQKAAALGRAYGEFLERYGAEPAATEGSIPGARLFKLFDTYELFFTVGRYLAGVHEGPAPAPTRALAERLKAGLNGTVHD